MNLKKLVLGTVQFGINYGINNLVGKPSGQLIDSILDLAWEKGILTLDTADVYGNAQALIGKYHETSGNIFEINSKFKANFISIEMQLERTLNELKVNNLNSYFYHDFKDFIQNPDLLDELTHLKIGGKFKQIGLSVYENSELELAISNPHIDIIQLPFNLFDNINERGILLKKAKEAKKTIQVRSIYLQGLFFKDLNSLPLKLIPLTPYLRKISEIANEYKLTIEELAMAYVVLQNQIDEVIIGVDNPYQLNENIELFLKNYNSSLTEEIELINIKEKELLYPKNWN